MLSAFPGAISVIRSIAHVAQPTVAGVARVAAHLAADQARRGWRVAVVSPPDGDLEGWAREGGAQHVSWAATRSPSPRMAGETGRLLRILRALDPDLVHLHSSKAGLAGRLALRGRRPTVFQPHAWSFEALSGAARGAAIRWERLGARWTHALVCVSEGERRRGEAMGIRAPYRLVPNPVDLGAVRPAGDDERAAARRRLDLGPAPLAVCVGRLSEQKGQDLLLSAWPKVLSLVPQARLVLVGDGPARAALGRRAGPGVSLVGERDDVLDWVAAADVVAAPSRWEGMSLTVLEAMAVGRSVVAFDVPGMRETVDDDAGATVPTGDLASLAGALAGRLRDPARADAEGRAGRGRVEREHDLRSIAERMVGVYDHVLEVRGRSRSW
jgi:glycosyltransferase involved in cell wall biosynthesis